MSSSKSTPTNSHSTGPTVFLKRTLENMFNLAYKKHVELKTECTYILELLKKPNADNDLKENTLIYIKPFELGIQTKYDKIQEVAVDCLQKLMAFGYISNTQFIDQEKTILDHVVLIICQSFEIGQSDSVQLQIIKALLTAVTNCNVTGTSLRLTIKTCFNISISTKNIDNAKTSKTALTQMLNKVFQRMENFKTSEEYISHFVKNVISNVISKNDSTKSSLSSYNKDAFFIFRALCKLSKQVPNSSSSESLEMKSRILSLTLISSILANSGPVFKNSYSFINDIKQHLCLSLLKNIVSPNSTIFNLSLSIFRTLVMFFKENLKVEIGTLLSNALLKILESSNSTYQHKILVIQAIYTIVQDPQTLVDLFVNYDSGMQYYNIYESIVKDLAKQIQQNNDINWVSPEQDVRIKITSLKALVTILKSMVNWTERKQKNEEKKDSSHELFEKQRTLKKGIQEAVSLFNSGEPKKAIKYAVENDLIKNDPLDIAKFLHTTEGLNKKEIGEYIGTSKHKEILDAFVKRFDFKGIDFIQALRSFLNAFRLPKEGQQIDIVVQKFAEKYYSDNQDQNFNNADACYVFTYSVIMLNTELHNPQFSYRERMSVQAFKKQNEGLNQTNDGTRQNFSEEFQETIYKQIKTDEIKLKGEEDQVNLSLLKESKEKDIKKKQILFDKEGDYIFNVTSNQLSTTWARHFDDTFYYSSEIEHVKPMWDVSFGPILPSLSGYFEKTDDIEVAKLCLEGFEYGIHISGMFDMTLPRDTFVNALYKFTGLSGLNQLKDKNLEAIKLLIKIAQTEGNYLKGSWSVVLNGISKLERLQNIQGLKEQQSMKRQQSFSSISRKVSMDIRVSPNEIIEQSNSQLLSGIDASVIDKIFHSSIDLDNEAIVEFVKCLCAVSSDEIFSITEVRDFSLKKLIEVAHYNILRIKLVWGKIWSHMSEHLIEVACKHENERIIMGSIDSLRQLAMKFLEQEEIANYHFQRDFLRPFLHIISQSNRAIIKEMIVEICNRIILHQHQNIKSGWKSIFAILQVAAGDSLLTVEKLAFSNIQVIMTDYFSLIPEAFTDLINCLNEFANNQHNSEISINAIDYVLQCSTNLVSGKVIPLEKIDDEFLFNEDKPHFILWFPIFSGLSRSVQDIRKPVRLKALATLFEILNQYGKFFTKGLWQVIFKGVLYPIFVEIQTKDSYTEWVNTTCEKAMILLVGLFSKYFNLIPFEFSNILHLLVTTVKKEDELLTKIAHKCLVQLVLDTSQHFTNENWNQICETFNLMSEKLKVKENLTLSIVNNQLLTVISIGDSLVSKYISSKHIISLLKTLDTIELNSRESLEITTDKEVLEVLLKQQSSIFNLELDILFKSKEKEFQEILHEKTLLLSERYIKIMDQNSHILHRVLVPVIVSLLNGINSFSEERFLEFIEKYYSHYCDMITSNHQQVQIALKEVFKSTKNLIKK